MHLEIERTENTIAAIRAKRESLAAQAEAVASKRKTVGFDMFDGNAKLARKKLADLNAELAALHEEIEGCDDALTEGQHRLVMAKAAEAAEVERRQAKMLEAELEKFETAGRNLQDALSTLVVASNVMADSLGRMNALGVSHPNREQFLTLTKNAVFRSLLQTPWKAAIPNVQLVPQRHSVGDLTRSWVSSIRASVSRRLGKRAA